MTRAYAKMKQLGSTATSSLKSQQHKPVHLTGSVQAKCTPLPAAQHSESATQIYPSVPVLLRKSHTRAQTPRLCNCQSPVVCPMSGRCLESAIIYRATVSSADGSKFYYGATEKTFKIRYAGHKESLTKRSKSSATSLSVYVWKLIDKSIQYSIKWDIVKQSSPYRCGTRTCDLCLTEKLFILNADPSTCINKNSDLMQKCRHSLKFKLEKCWYYACLLFPWYPLPTCIHYYYLNTHFSWYCYIV